MEKVLRNKLLSDGEARPSPYQSQDEFDRVYKQGFYVMLFLFHFQVVTDS